MSDSGAFSKRLENALRLKSPPVAITFMDEATAGGSGPEAAVPAGCRFWEDGATKTLVTTAEHHRFCSVGVHTHNFAAAPPTQRQELASSLAAMQGLDYVRPDEVDSLPVRHEETSAVVYGPLQDLKQQPALVLIFADSAQGLIITEAVTRVDGRPPFAMGRPACALIPQALNTSRSATSLGCCGARAYLDVLTDNVAIWGLVGAKLAAYVAEIETLSAANTTLGQFHELRRTSVEAGEEPTVEQSLRKLQAGR